MRIRAAAPTIALAAALAAAPVLPTALTGPVAPAYAVAAVCQGQPATIEGSTGTITGTEGNDVIVAHRDGSGVRALGGNDLICVVGGDVYTGPGDDSVCPPPRPAPPPSPSCSAATTPTSAGPGPATSSPTSSPRSMSS